jgi:hypothetical protein
MQIVASKLFNSVTRISDTYSESSSNGAKSVIAITE